MINVKLRFYFNNFTSDIATCALCTCTGFSPKKSHKKKKKNYKNGKNQFPEYDNHKIKFTQKTDSLNYLFDQYLLLLKKKKKKNGVRI